MPRYQHDYDDPLINNLHTSMELVDGIPHQRVTLGSDNITITGNVNVATEPVPLAAVVDNAVGVGAVGTLLRPLLTIS